MNFVGNAIPTFKWTSNGDFDYRIQISFPDGGPDDVALLKPSIPSFSSDIVDKNDTGCIFHGHLRDENEVSVYVSGCPTDPSFQVFNNHSIFMATNYIFGRMFSDYDSNQSINL